MTPKWHGSNGHRTLTSGFRRFRTDGIRALALAALLAALHCAGIAFPAHAAHAATARELVRGVQRIEATLPWYDPVGDAVSSAAPRPLEEGMALLLSKAVYPADDGYLDAVVWLDGEAGEPVPGRLEVALLDDAGAELGRETVAPLPGNQVFFSVAFPDALVGRGGMLHVIWTRPGTPDTSASRSFAVAGRQPVQQSGRVRIDIPNETGAFAESVPFTVGVPFPRGALRSAENVRLLDEQGREVPSEVRTTARWSRYGSVKWVLCEFAADVEGAPRTFALEFGPGVSRAPAPGALEVAPRAAGFPLVRAGALEVRETGLYYDRSGEGDFRRVLEPDALLGGYVEHEDGRIYRMAPPQTPEVETPGERQTVLKTSGYYRDAESGREFCKYRTRFHFHHGSPMLRIVHTWIYTGDSNRDRIADMGWRFPLAEGMQPEGFLLSFEDGDWTPGGYLLQHDHNLYDLAGGPAEARDAPGRLPGAMAASDGQVRFAFGARDFWQNFPSELGMEDGAMTFHNWPRHGRARRHSPATRDDAFRLWFAHEGEVMDLSLPDEFAQNPIWRAIHHGVPYEIAWDEGRPEHTNAQGVARTEEMWLHFGPAESGAGRKARLFAGLNDETLRAVPDPEWVVASGAFHEIHHRDVENFPEHEETFEEVALAPGRWTDRMGHYGMWIYGDSRWEPLLWRESSNLYRSLRKAHHGWPYSWVPYARSGDPRFLRLAHAATRQIYDASTCHYFTEAVDRVTGPERPRRRGLWIHGPLPWHGRIRSAGTRTYQAKSDFFWHAYYLTGDRRALDVVRMIWTEEMKVEEPMTARDRVRVARPIQSMLKGAVDMYEADHDPWHLAFAHALAEMEQARHKDPGSNYVGHTWDAAEWAFLRFAGCADFRDNVALPYARHFGSENYGRWGAQSLFEPNALGWWHDGDEHFLRRLAAELDWARQSHYRGEPDYYRGYHLREGTSAPLYVSWFLKDFPLALGALAAAGAEPTPIPNRFWQSAEATERAEGGRLLRMPLVAFRKEAGKPVPLSIAVSQGDGRWGGDFTGRYRVVGGDGEMFLEGEWDLRQAHGEVVLPADAPPGTYWLAVEAQVARAAGDWPWPYRFLQGLQVPVTPPGTPEVLVFNRGFVERAVWEAQYWFRVPDDAERLEVGFFVRPRHREVRRMSVWNADGEKVWDHNMEVHSLGERESKTVAAEIEVPASQRGHLWRITWPGRSGGFQIRGDVRPAFSGSSDRWFDPGERPEAGE